MPKHYETLRENGVTGAIDLALALAPARRAHDRGRVVSSVPEAPPESFRLIVNQVDQDAKLVYDTAAQLFYEEQVRLLWVMYNCFSTTAAGVDLSFEGRSARSALSSGASPATEPRTAAGPANDSSPAVSQTQLTKPAAEPPAGEVRKK